MVLLFRRKDYPFYYRNTDKYPTELEQRKWIKTYLSTFIDQKTAILENNCMDKVQISNLQNNEKLCEDAVLQEIQVFSLSSHLLWTLWSLKQAQYSNIPFAYYSFARDRMEDYKITKEIVIQRI